MRSRAAASRKLPLAPLILAGVAAIALIAAVIYLNRPARQSASASIAEALPESKAYVPYLQLSDVAMSATENFMKQQVIEIAGKLGNKGPRVLKSVDVYCLFYDVQGHEIYRERLPMMKAQGAPLRPNETRSFRLAFDTLPDSWNQAMPKLVIAQIVFAKD